MWPCRFLMANLSAFYFPSHPWVSIPKIALIQQLLWSQLCLWPACLLLQLWCSQTTALLVFKLTVLPSSARCRAGNLWNPQAHPCVQDTAGSESRCPELGSWRTTGTSHGGEVLQLLQLPEMLKATQALRGILTHCKSLFWGLTCPQTGYFKGLWAPCKTHIPTKVLAERQWKNLPLNAAQPGFEPRHHQQLSTHLVFSLTAFRVLASSSNLIKSFSAQCLSGH